MNLCVCYFIFFLFCKRKTAYEVRISDWSSDVCSSDLPFFNALDGLVNVPKSRVKGAELELSARVVEGLTVSAAATYIDAKVRHYQGIVGSVANEVGLFDPIRGDLSGARLPFSPKWQSSLKADSSLPLGGVNLTVGPTISSPRDTTTVWYGKRVSASVHTGGWGVPKHLKQRKDT